MARTQRDPERLIEQISLILEVPASVHDAVEEVQLLISDHWNFIETDEDQDRADALRVELNAAIESEAAIHRRAGEYMEIAAARKILEDLAEDLEQDEDAPRIHPQEQLELFDGPNEWPGGDRAGFEREQAAWIAIADGLGNLGYELNSAEETRDWVVRNLL